MKELKCLRENEVKVSTCLDAEEGKTAPWVSARKAVELLARNKWKVINIQKENIKLPETV